MPELFKRESELSSAHSMAWWTSTGSQMQQSSISRNLSFKMATPPKPNQHGKHLEFHSHDQDSSSTQSTGQSYPEVACGGQKETCKKNAHLKESGYPVVQGQSDEAHGKSSLSSHDYTSPPSQVDYRQSFGTIPFPYPNNYCSGIVAAFGTHPVVHPQMMWMTPARVPLPLDFPHDEPIYVNAKQYRAILRRREYRAKLEAQNKLAKARKPYLHESRHRHALNRARGPGGRFLNAKKLQESNSTTDGEDNSGFAHSLSTRKMWGAEVHHLGYNQDCELTTSSSEITCASNVDNIFHQQEFGFSVYASHGEDGIPGIQHYLSVPP